MISRRRFFRILAAATAAVVLGPIAARRDNFVNGQQWKAPDGVWRFARAVNKRRIAAGVYEVDFEFNYTPHFGKTVRGWQEAIQLTKFQPPK